MKTATSRQEVEDFLFQEADCLDRWALDEWLGLWMESGEIGYEIAPTGLDDAEDLDPRDTLFLIADDRFRLEQRIVRMKKRSFHAEYVRSRTRHMYGHVRIVGQDANALNTVFNSAVFRSRQGTSVVYPSVVRVALAKTDEGLRLVRKRIELDLEHLAPMGALTIIL